MSVGGKGPGGHSKEGFSSAGMIGRPLVIEDPERHVNELAVVQTSPRRVISVLSWSNPQAHIVAHGYHFEWYEGEMLQDSRGKSPLLRHPLANPAVALHTLVALVDPDGKTTECGLFMDRDVSGNCVASWSFSHRWINLWPMAYHLEWTLGVGVAEVTGDKRLVLPPGVMG
jgi:hypothetical protein